MRLPLFGHPKAIVKLADQSNHSIAFNIDVQRVELREPSEDSN